LFLFAEHLGIDACRRVDRRAERAGVPKTFSITRCIGSVRKRDRVPPARTVARRVRRWGRTATCLTNARRQIALVNRRVGIRKQRGEDGLVEIVAISARASMNRRLSHPFCWEVKKQARESEGLARCRASTPSLMGSASIAVGESKNCRVSVSRSSADEKTRRIAAVRHRPEIRR
jgi:hypothetical protein